ncbi:YerC/YecD family TrpR-related protein [Natronospora cellulosivora (SeqCode)]
MSKSIKDDFTDHLFDAILTLKNREECYSFFEDIATIGELKALGQRLEVAKMLREGATYEEIVEKTGVSTATISRVKRALYYGADGYSMILDRLED